MVMSDRGDFNDGPSRYHVIPAIYHITEIGFDILFGRVDQGFGLYFKLNRGQYELKEEGVDPDDERIGSFNPYYTFLGQTLGVSYKF